MAFILLKLKRNVVYCFYCQKINSLGGVTFNKRSDSSFITKEFCNWKKAKEKFREHEASQTHHEAIFKYESLQRPSIMTLTISCLKKDQELRRKMLLIQLLFVF